MCALLHSQSIGKECGGHLELRTWGYSGGPFQPLPYCDTVILEMRLIVLTLTHLQDSHLFKMITEPPFGANGERPPCLVSIHYTLRQKSKQIRWHLEVPLFPTSAEGI